MANDSENGEARGLQAQLELSRIELEHIRLTLERQHEFLYRWNINLDRPNKWGIEAYKSSVAFAQSGLRSATLMNGGALLVLPAFASVLDLKGNPLIVWPMIAFAVGIVCAVLGMLFGYLVSEHVVAAYNNEASEIAINLNKERAEGDRADELKIEAATAKKDYETAWKQAKTYSVIGLCVAIASVVAFVIGGGVTAYLVLR